MTAREQMLNTRKAVSTQYKVMVMEGRNGAKDLYTVISVGPAGNEATLATTYSNRIAFATKRGYEDGTLLLGELAK